jgi:hypothetical protein
MQIRAAYAWLASAGILALTAGPAAGQSLTNDAKCLLVSNIFSKSNDAKAKELATQARFFFLGRMTGSPSQIEAALASQGKTIDAQNVASIMQSCAAAVVQKAREVQAIGERLSKAGAR